MKKGGILNKDLMAELTGLGHLDMFVICDAGFPVPQNAKKIDLAIVENLPSFMQTLKAVLNEVIIEELILAEETKEVSNELFNKIEEIFENQEKKLLPFNDFFEHALKAKFFIRTGDFTPYANIVLKSASGVKKYNKKYDLSFNQII